MPLTPKERTLVDRILNEEIQWRVQRWFVLLMVLGLPVFGYFLTDVIGEKVALLCYVVAAGGLVQILSRWRGSATNQLVMELAKRIDESKDDA